VLNKTFNNENPMAMTPANTNTLASRFAHGYIFLCRPMLLSLTSSEFLVGT